MGRIAGTQAGTSGAGSGGDAALAAARASWSAIGGWVTAGVLLAAFVAVFHGWFYTQARHSFNRPDDWGHAFLVPLISGWLLWRNRSLLVRLPVRTFWPGLVPLFAGLIYYLVCVVYIRNHMLQGASLILTLYGLVLLLTGPAMSRATFIPIAFLAFMVTIAEIIMIHVTFQLQLIASQGSHVMLALLGPVFGYATELRGNIIDVVILSTNEVRPLHVAEACSGMRMVIAFYALATAVAVGGFPGFECPRWWQRILLVLLAGPIAILMNMLRVTVLGLASLIDANLAAGEAHSLIGMLLLVPSLFAFLGVVWVLQRVESPEPAAAAAPVRP